MLHDAEATMRLIPHSLKVGIVLIASVVLSVGCFSTKKGQLSNLDGYEDDAVTSDAADSASDTSPPSDLQQPGDLQPPQDGTADGGSDTVEPPDQLPSDVALDTQVDAIDDVGQIDADVDSPPDAAGDTVVVPPATASYLNQLAFCDPNQHGTYGFQNFGALVNPFLPAEIASRAIAFVIDFTLGNTPGASWYEGVLDSGENGPHPWNWFVKKASERVLTAVQIQGGQFAAKHPKFDLNLSYGPDSVPISIPIYRTQFNSSFTATDTGIELKDGVIAGLVRQDELAEAIAAGKLYCQSHGIEQTLVCTVLFSWNSNTTEHKDYAWLLPNPVVVYYQYTDPEPASLTNQWVAKICLNFNGVKARVTGQID